VTSAGPVTALPRCDGRACHDGLFPLFLPPEFFNFCGRGGPAGPPAPAFRCRSFAAPSLRDSRLRATPRAVSPSIRGDFSADFRFLRGARKWVSTLGGRPGAESTAPFDRATPTFYRSLVDSERLRRAVFEISRSKGSKGDVLTDRALAYDGARWVIAPFVRGPASRVFVNRTRSHARRSPLLLASSQRTLKISAENGRFFVGFSAVEFLPIG
jgi:hypothetical protein